MGVEEVFFDNGSPRGAYRRIFFIGGKIYFSYSTDGTGPIIRYVDKLCTSRNTSIDITNYWIIDIATGDTYPFLSFFLHFWKWRRGESETSPFEDFPESISDKDKYWSKLEFDTPIIENDMDDDKKSDHIGKSMEPFPPFSELSHGPVARSQCERKWKKKTKKSECKKIDLSLEIPKISSKDERGVIDHVSTPMYQSECPHKDTELFAKWEELSRDSESDDTRENRYPENHPENEECLLTTIFDRPRIQKIEEWKKRKKKESVSEILSPVSDDFFERLEESIYRGDHRYERKSVFECTNFW
jgi:hypothetical protein